MAGSNIKKQATRNMGIGILFLFACLAPLSSLAANPVGTVTKAEGTVQVLRAGAAPPQPARAGTALFPRDMIVTQSEARAEITFKDGNLLRLAQRTRIDISEYLADQGENSRKLRLTSGKVEAVVAKKVVAGAKAQRFEITTPTAICGVRGTRFFVGHDVDISEILVKDGIVFALNPEFPDDMIDLPAGTVSQILAKKPPTRPRPATAREIRQYEQETGTVDQGKESAEKLKAIRDFYTRFREAYESRNEAQLLALISDDWQSGDDTTTQELQKNLHHSFGVFNSIRYAIANLVIVPMSDTTYRISYDVTITGKIYEYNTTHEEKSRVDEEVTIDAKGHVRITRTLKGRYW